MTVISPLIPELDNLADPGKLLDLSMKYFFS